MYRIYLESVEVEPMAVLTIRSLAVGEQRETELASWIENNCAPI